MTERGIRISKSKCVICGKTLSDHNRKDICFCHQPNDYVPTRFAPTKCSSRNVPGFSVAMIDYYGNGKYC